MDERLIYSFILIVSLMFLCLLLPLDPKEVKDIQSEGTTHSPHQLLIAYLLYPKLTAELLSQMDSISQLIIASNQIKLVDLKRVGENELLITLEFPSFVSTERMADYRVVYQIDALGNITKQSFETVTMDQKSQDLLAKANQQQL